MMDFLSLFLIYIALWMLLIASYMFSDSALLTSTAAMRVRKTIAKLLSSSLNYIPQTIRVRASVLFDYIFFQRNRLFQVLYVLLLAGCLAVLLTDAVPYLRLVAPAGRQSVWLAVLLALNAAAFIASSVTDAGRVCVVSLARYANVYGYDGALYKPDCLCRTCLFIKPARSKHCAMSDVCIFKFDHYCVWTNNCVGGLNHRYFIAFLFSLSTLGGYALLMTFDALRAVVSVHDMWALRYLDVNDVAQPITIQILIQTLFLQFPRLVLLFAAVLPVCVGVAAFAVYHVYLAVTNQTTNERYKRRHAAPSHGRRPAAGARPYDRGLLANVRQELFPLTVVRSKKLT